MCGSAPTFEDAKARAELALRVHPPVAPVQNVPGGPLKGERAAPVAQLAPS